MKRIILPVLTLLISTSAFAAEWTCYGALNGEQFNKHITLPKNYDPRLDKRIPLIEKDGVVVSVVGDDSFLHLSNGQSVDVEVTGNYLYFSDLSVKKIGVVCHLVK